MNFEWTELRDTYHLQCTLGPVTIGGVESTSNGDDLYRAYFGDRTLCEWLHGEHPIMLAKTLVEVTFRALCLELLNTEQLEHMRKLREKG